MNGLHEEIYDSEYEADFEGEMFGDQEADFEADFEADYETGYDQGEGPFNEEQELELAAELLAVSEEAELDQFLGKLIRRVAPAARKFLGSAAGQSLKGFLKNTAKKALPMVGRAVGGYFGGAKGGDIGAKLASAGGQIFGLELEGMSPEDQELEVAKRFVRLAGDAVTQAAQTAGSGSPQQAARSAIVAAAQKHAPGLLRSGNGAGAGLGQAGGKKKSGKWFRRGRTIVLVGV